MATPTNVPPPHVDPKTPAHVPDPKPPIATHPNVPNPKVEAPSKPELDKQNASKEMKSETAAPMQHTMTKDERLDPASVKSMDDNPKEKGKHVGYSLQEMMNSSGDKVFDIGGEDGYSNTYGIRVLSRDKSRTLLFLDKDQDEQAQLHCKSVQKMKVEVKFPPVDFKTTAKRRLIITIGDIKAKIEEPKGKTKEPEKPKKFVYELFFPVDTSFCHILLPMDKAVNMTYCPIPIDISRPVDPNNPNLPEDVKAKGKAPGGDLTKESEVIEPAGTAATLDFVSNHSFPRGVYDASPIGMEYQNNVITQY